MNTGTCAFCCASNVSLRESHIVPSWAYKRQRANESKVPHPVRIRDGGAVQTSHQFKERLLCDDCEKRFGTFDNYAASLAYDIGIRAPIFSQIAIEDAPRGTRYVPARAITLNVERIAYVGLSVLWRGHAARCLPDCSFGNRGEAMRLFLRREKPLANDVALVLLAYDDAADGPMARTVYMPRSQRERGYFSHMFLICGLHFFLAVGRELPAFYGAFSLFHGAIPRVLVTHSSTGVQALQNLIRDARPLGRLRDS